jgi:predicted O-linked N-acetylglucosamine transferase (SPINDLY family)
MHNTHINYYYKLGSQLKSIGRFEDAKKCYVHILNTFPTDIDILFDMAFACQNLGQNDDAIKWYNRLLEIEPNHAQTHINKGHIYRIHGFIQQACNHFMRAKSNLNNDGLDILSHISLPVIYQSNDEIHFYRKRLKDYVTNHQVHLEDPLKQVGITQFFLAYHGLDDTDIQKTIADFYERSCSSLKYVSPYLNQTKEQGKITIGFATTFLFESHPVGKVFQCVIKYMNRQQFRVILFHPSGASTAQSKLHQLFKQEIIHLPRDLSQCREIISKEKPDILFYPEIGMDPLIYFLAFSRLARVQCVGWGHPVTSGIKNIDYYISSTDMEPDNGMMHYTEQLVLLKTFITCFKRPQIRKLSMKRSDFDLPEGHWYVCPQNIQKIHPDMDILLAKILKKDLKGWILLFEGKYPVFTQQLKNRLKKSIPEVSNRIIFVEKMPIEQFLQFLHLCDAVLDVPFFSSGTTTIEAISMGIPIVTLSGKFLRNRLAYGCFKRINVLDTVAKNLDQYVLLANQLACDMNFRNQVSKKIVSNNDVLFDNHEVVRAYEQFFIHIHKIRRK